jgi:hypothetical protein
MNHHFHERRVVTIGDGTLIGMKSALDALDLKEGDRIEIRKKADGCVSCGGSITEAKNAYLEMVAYDTPKQRKPPGAGSSLIEREPTGRAMCHDCATSLKNGVAPGQGSLVG